jgi:hypothetical protein
MGVIRSIGEALMILAGLLILGFSLLLFEMSGRKFICFGDALLFFSVVGVGCALVFFGWLLIAKEVKKETRLRIDGQFFLKIFLNLLAWVSILWGTAYLGTEIARIPAGYLNVSQLGIGILSFVGGIGVLRSISWTRYLIIFASLWQIMLNLLFFSKYPDGFMHLLQITYKYRFLIVFPIIVTIFLMLPKVKELFKK